MRVVILLELLTLWAANVLAGKETAAPFKQETESIKTLSPSAMQQESLHQKEGIVSSSSNYEADSKASSDIHEEEPPAYSATLLPAQVQNATLPSSVLIDNSTESVPLQSKQTPKAVAHSYQPEKLALPILKRYKESASTLSSSTNEMAKKSTQLDVTQNGVNESELEKFLFGSFSTTTYTNVIASTSTVFFSCLSLTTTGTLCQGRGARRKRFAKPAFQLEEIESLTDVESSEDSERSSAGGNPNHPGSNEDRLAFTVWTTSRRTTSVTVYYTNTSTTLRLAYYCLAGGINYPTFSCRIAA